MAGQAGEAMSVKSQRVKDVLFGKGTGLMDAYMAGRHLEGRVINMARARIASEKHMRRLYVGWAREDHHKFLACVAKIKQLECV
jgi:hypothetical protein